MVLPPVRSPCQHATKPRRWWPSWTPVLSQEQKHYAVAAMLCFSVTSSRTYLIRARKGRGGERKCEEMWGRRGPQIWCWGWAPGHFLGLPPRFPRTGVCCRRLSIFFAPLFNTNFTTFEMITMFEHKAPLDTRCITKEWPRQLESWDTSNSADRAPGHPHCQSIVALHVLDGTLMNIRTYPSSSFEFISELISQASTCRT